MYQYNRFVKKAYDEYIKPTMRYANIIVPFGSDNTTAIDFIVTNLKTKLQEIQARKKLISIKSGGSTTPTHDGADSDEA